MEVAHPGTKWFFVYLIPDRIGIWKCWFLGRWENRSTWRKTSRSKGEEPTTNSTHIRRQRRELNPDHVGGRRALSPLGHPLLSKYIINDFLALHFPPTNCIYLAARNLRGSPREVLSHFNIDNYRPFQAFFNLWHRPVSEKSIDTAKKKRLNKSRIATFESYLLKKDEHITVQLGRATLGLSFRGCRRTKQ